MARLSSFLNAVLLASTVIAVSNDFRDQKEVEARQVTPTTAPPPTTNAISIPTPTIAIGLANFTYTVTYTFDYYYYVYVPEYCVIGSKSAVSTTSTVLTIQGTDKAQADAIISTLTKTYSFFTPNISPTSSGTYPAWAGNPSASYTPCEYSRTATAGPTTGLNTTITQAGPTARPTNSPNPFEANGAIGGNGINGVSGKVLVLMAVLVAGLMVML